MLDNKVRELIQANLKLAGTEDDQVGPKYRRGIMTALELPLQNELLEGNLVNEIFERIDAVGYNGSSMPFPTAAYNFANNNNYRAFAIPRCGYIPRNIVEGAELLVPFYRIGNSQGTCLNYIRDGRWDIMKDLYDRIRSGFAQKMNDDGFHAILASADSRNVVVQDSAASAGEFTKKLIADMAVRMTREGGGHTASMDRFKLTDMFVSPEALAQAYAWDESELDATTRREMNSKAAYEGFSLFNIRVRPLDELGVVASVEKEYEAYIETTLGRAHTNSDTQYVLGMDLSRRRGLVMPVKEEMKLFEDPTAHRNQQWEIYGWMEVGFAQLDSRLSILGSF